MLIGMLIKNKNKNEEAIFIPLLYASLSSHLVAFIRLMYCITHILCSFSVHRTISKS